MNPKDEFEPNYDGLDESLRQPEKVKTYSRPTNEINVEDLNKLFESFDRMANEVNQMFALLSQGIAIALQPMHDSLEDLKTKVEAFINDPERLGNEEENDESS